MCRVIVTLILLLVAGPARAVDITACGQSVPDLDVGVLQGDLDCGGAPVGVIVGRRATLQLNGHAISNLASLSPAVSCPAGCTVLGPGELAAGGGNGIILTGGSLRVTGGVDIHDCHIGILSTSRGRLLATDLAVRNSAVYGVLIRGLRGTNVSLTDNASYGVSAGRVSVLGLVATGNGEEGVQAGRAVLRESTVTGNDALGEGVDIVASRALRVVATTCGKSQKPDGTTWGVCTND